MVESVALKEGDKNLDSDFLSQKLGMGQLHLEMDDKEDEAKLAEAKAEAAKKLEAEKPKAEVPKVPEVPEKPKDSKIPEKFKGKSAEEIADAYVNLEKLVDKKAEEKAAELVKKQVEKPAEKPKINSDDLLEKPDEVLRPLIREEIRESLEENERKNKETERKKAVVYAKAKEEGINLDVLTQKMTEIIQNPELMPDAMFKDPNVNTYLIAYNMAKGMTDVKTLEQAKQQEIADEAAKARGALESSGASGEKPPQKELTPEDEVVQGIMDARSKLSFFETMP
jgi:hypothetical protein